jgi:transposase InsO family protein
MDPQDREKIALWRLSVLGPLISARLLHGDRRDYFAQAAARTHQHPSGRLVHVAARTVESWYYAYQRGGLAALHPQTRGDQGRSRAISKEVADLIVRAKQEKPRRSIRRIIGMLERAGVVPRGQLSHSSVHRLLRQAGISQRPPRGPSAERRSFLFEYTGELWIGDALHGPMVLGPDGKLHKSYLLSQLDCATRFVVHSFFALSEGAAQHERGFKQALLKYGRPRAYYVDNGAAYISHSLRMICAELAIHLLHTAAGDAEAKGAIERWHRSLREELLDELGPGPLTLGELNSKLWAWLGSEYHSRIHSTTGRAPREHLLSQTEHLRPVPKSCNLDELFLHREKRLVRKDGTVRWDGQLLEVRAELCGQTVELRFDPGEPQALPRVFRDGRFFCNTVPLDRLGNATRPRHRLSGEPAPTAEPTGLCPLALIEAEHYHRVHLPLAQDPDSQED